MTDVFKQLGKLKVDGLLLPISNRRAGFASDQARHKVQFRNGEIVEPLGSRNWTLEYTIPFRSDIVRGPYRDLFSRGLPRFLRSCTESALNPIDLYDPILGYFRVTCISLQEQSVSQKRDGTDVTAQFLWVPLPTRTSSSILNSTRLGDVVSSSNEAGILDREIGNTYRSKQKAPPPALVNPLAAISGLLKQIETRGNQIQAKIADFSSQVQEIEDGIQAFEEPDLSPTIRSLRNLRDNAESMKNRVTSPARIRMYSLTADMTIGELASHLGVEVSGIVKLNPQLALNLPLIRKGTLVRFLTDEGDILGSGT